MGDVLVHDDTPRVNWKYAVIESVIRELQTSSRVLARLPDRLLSSVSGSRIHHESHSVITDIYSSGDSAKESASQASDELPDIRSLRKAAMSSRARERVSEWASILESTVFYVRPRRMSRSNID